jgi:hypothetical protein
VEKQQILILFSYYNICSFIFYFFILTFLFKTSFTIYAFHAPVGFSGKSWLLILDQAKPKKIKLVSVASPQSMQHVINPTTIQSRQPCDCCLTPSEQFISHIMARASYISIKL